MEMSKMKSFILAAIAALSLTAGIAPVANAASFGRPDSTNRQGPYDNTANSHGNNYVGGDN
jgi:hypothetical protein